MTLKELENDMSHLWAKSPRADSSEVTLFRHSLDVVGQMAEYYHLYQSQWPLPEESVCVPRILAYAALTHDFGKVHVDFQKALRPGGERFQNRHEILSLAFLDYLEIPEPERPWLEAAVGLHHKNLFALVGANRPFFLGEKFGAKGTAIYHLVSGVKPEEAEHLSEFLNHASEMFDASPWLGVSCYEVRSSQITPAESIQTLRGALERITALARRFEAKEDDFGNPVGPIPWPERRAAVQVRGFMLNADHLASFEPHPLRVGLEHVDDVRAAISPNVPKPNSHQGKAAAQTGSAILVAPTGTGKTEVGLLWAARQVEVSGVRGRTFVLLPYQASMNAMQKRLLEAFAPDAIADPAIWPSEVALIHGRSMRTAYERLLVT
jgi:CRISPR-associated endonuclease/helicase Cas3